MILVKLLDQSILQLLKNTITRLLKIRGDIFICRMRIGEGEDGKELKIVKYGHPEEAIPPSKLPNISFLFKLNHQYIYSKV